MFSIGHSNHELTRFLQLLQDAGVNAIADVRSQPFSQRCPQFNRPELQRSLYEHDVVYAAGGDGNTLFAVDPRKLAEATNARLIHVAPPAQLADK